VAIALVIFLLARGGGTDKSKVSATKSPSTTAGADAGSAGAQTGAAGSGSAAGGSTDGAQAGGKPATGGLGGTKNMPLDVTVSNTNGLKDGDVVSIHVVPKKGSVIYGFETFLCRGGTQYRFDADIRASYTGNCVTKPLSAISQEYMAVRAGPPYSSVDATFRVGVGSDSYKTGDGKQVTVTCGHGSPCTLVLKLQYPNAFGFQPIPLTFR
jgi:hypothetical protein